MKDCGLKLQLIKHIQHHSRIQPQPPLSRQTVRNPTFYLVTEKVEKGNLDQKLLLCNPFKTLHDTSPSKHPILKISPKSAMAAHSIQLLCGATRIRSSSVTDTANPLSSRALTWSGPSSSRFPHCFPFRSCSKSISVVNKARFGIRSMVRESEDRNASDKTGNDEVLSTFIFTWQIFLESGLKWCLIVAYNYKAFVFLRN